MKKSKETIRKTLILILVLLLAIFLLESNSVYQIRTFVASIIPFFQGKRLLFSNILIGILGSAIILVFGEIITYRHEKQELQLEILKLYQKWNNHIIDIAQKAPKGFQGLTLLANYIEKYAEKVDLIYNDYVPYFRGGTYFQLLRTLYKYTNAVTDYSDTINRHTNQKLALLDSIAQCNTSKSLTTVPKEISSIEKILSELKEHLATLDAFEIDEEKILEEINTYKNAVIDISNKAEYLAIFNKLNGLDLKDTRSEFDRTLIESKKTMRKFNRELFFMKLKSLSPNHLLNDYKAKKLQKKYNCK